MTAPPADSTAPLVVRDLPAPPPLVHRAWTDADLLARWIGPRGYTVPRDTVTVEPRVGGRFDYCLVESAESAESAGTSGTSDGTRHWLRSHITELAVPRLLVLTSAPMPEHGTPAPVTTRVHLAPAPPGTRLTFTRPYPPDRRPTARATWSTSFDNLEALLRTLA
ncbi:SRPBCC domain-containing protein [Streptomyces sp. WMMC500]|uniref:SRPBCC family protein n=1 Tax=Streptomyces sp. WMMC500 TaxID=3015154 RepID=UPI00248B3CE4|nr:SRPBCC domain-containing protein [Streptomyces sp. WMMC500]WBB59541.1 SRPBCC domain-containing protein [Streptomyces sp. WMMC500]